MAVLASADCVCLLPQRPAWPSFGNRKLGTVITSVTGTASATRGFRLAKEHLELISRLAKLDYPREVCGLLLSRAGSTTIHVAKNVAQEPERSFAVDTESMRHAARMLQSDWRLDAIWHSHTNGLLELSPGDRDGAMLAGRALYPNVVYIVVALVQNPANDKEFFTSATAWAWLGDSPTPAPLKLVVHSS